MNTVTEPEILRGADGSVNFVWRLEPGLAMEARLVQRKEDEIIVYLSSQWGCRQGCQMCHLTRTRQTSSLCVDAEGFMTQAATVLTHAEEAGLLRLHGTVNFNFMARGEPLANPGVDSDLLCGLAAIAKSTKFNLRPRFKISTTMPCNDMMDLRARFDVIHPDIYYSLYGVDQDFRRKWFPNAAPVDCALEQLVEWQEHTHKIPKIHLALIKGVNDRAEDPSALKDVLENSGLRFDINIVRYNPHETDKHEEGDWEGMADYLQWQFPDATVQVVDRVGFDVKASCGMFVS